MVKRWYDGKMWKCELSVGIYFIIVKFIVVVNFVFNSNFDKLNVFGL